MKDIIIIGAGPGGYEAAIRGAQLGASVCLIESDAVGGTCLNRGCIPTKALYRNAEIINNIKHADDFGVELGPYSLNLDKIRNRKIQIIDELVGGIHQLIDAHQIELIKGTGKLVDAHTVAVETESGVIQIQGKNIIIATGSVPSSVPIPGADHPEIYTSNEMLELRDIPEKLVVIGGGVVGVEFASIYNALGSRVTLMARSQILPFLDADVYKRLGMSMKKAGVTLETGISYKAIEKTDTGFTVVIEDKKGERRYEADKVLLATGRSPVMANLGLEKLGIETTRKGITVNKHFQTNVPNIYAIGDVNGLWMLAHVASHQGIDVVERLMGLTPEINHDIVPNCVFSFPEVSSVGQTETALKEAGIPYESNKFMFAANGKALSLGEGDGFVKVIESAGKIVGVHILGPHASDLIHEATLIVKMGLTVKDVATTIHAHPTLSEAFVEATLGLHNEAIHMLPKKKRRE